MKKQGQRGARSLDELCVCVLIYRTRKDVDERGKEH